MGISSRGRAVLFVFVLYFRPVVDVDEDRT